jgi:hypothetical protein
VWEGENFLALCITLFVVSVAIRPKYLGFALVNRNWR